MHPSHASGWLAQSVSPLLPAHVRFSWQDTLLLMSSRNYYYYDDLLRISEGIKKVL